MSLKLIIVFFCYFFCGLQCQKPNIPPISQKAQDLIKYMNLTADPCEDFYEFACGNFKTEFPSRNIHSYPVTILQQLEDKIDQDLLKLLIQPLQSNENIMHQQPKDFYSSCTSVDKIIRVGNEPIKSVIRALGGIPLLDHHWDERSFDWMNTVSDFKYKFNLDILISLTVRDDESRNSRALYLDSPKSQPIHKLFKSKGDALKDITSLLQKFSTNAVEVSRVANEVYEVECNLYKNNPETIAYGRKEFKEWNIYQRYSETLDFDKYVSASIHDSRTSFRKYVATNGYFENLLQVTSSTSKKSMANYIMWNFIRQMNITNDQVKDINRRKFCLQLTKHYFPMMLGVMYNQVNQNILIRAEREVNLLKGYLKSSLMANGFEWTGFDKDIVKPTIQYKLENMKVNLIKYNMRDVREMMPSLNRTAIQASHFLQNILNMMETEAARFRNDIYNTNKKGADTSIEGFSVYPSYQPDQNAIRVPTGIFNYPLYNQDFPNSTKFGQIGVLISREIIKSLTKGSNRSYRWVDRVLDKYYDRIRCFVKQYNGFHFGGGYLPENENQEENIADNGAIRMAFKAYLRWLMDGTISTEVLDNETLKDVDFTNTQLFFIAYAQTYCSNLVESKEFIWSANEDFMPEKIRVNAALSNFDEFSTEFNCYAGSFMNAPDKCVLY